jgi:uncharacterized membrane protein YgdD (TMEM256/DUF423 family)
MTRHTRFLRIGAFLAAVGVAAGAFGAHYLEALVGGTGIDTFETGVRYHLLHALALVLTGLVPASQQSNKWVNRAGWLFLAGIALFSGSLYILVLAGIPWMGAVAPLGGLSLIAGWISLGLAAGRPTG